MAPHSQLRGSWAQWTATTAATATTITSLKGNWISSHNIAAVIQDSAATRSAQDSAAIRSADDGEESRYLLGFERDYVEPGPNVNNNLDAPSPQPFPSNWWISLVDCEGTWGSGKANSNMYKNRDWTCTNIWTWFLAWEKVSFLSVNAIEFTVKLQPRDSVQMQNVEKVTWSCYLHWVPPVLKAEHQNPRL